MAVKAADMVLAMTRGPKIELVGDLDALLRLRGGALVKIDAAREVEAAREAPQTRTNTRSIAL